METWIRNGFVGSDNCEFSDLGDGYLTLEGIIECAGGLLYIDVKKRIRIVEGAGPNAIVQTEDYSYGAILRGKGTVFRYDAPHDTHREHHHVHRSPVLDNPEIETVEELSGDAWPTLGEVIDELSKWYYENYDRIELARQELEKPKLAL